MGACETTLCTLFSGVATLQWFAQCSHASGEGLTGVRLCCVSILEPQVDAQNSITEATPLHCAAQDATRGDAEGRVRCIQLLLAAGADPDLEVHHRYHEQDVSACACLCTLMRAQSYYAHERLADACSKAGRGCLSTVLAETRLLEAKVAPESWSTC